jgi:hypothetical protein
MTAATLPVAPAGAGRANRADHGFLVLSGNVVLDQLGGEPRLVVRAPMTPREVFAPDRPQASTAG